MRSDRDKRSKNEKEIDDFLSQFETPVEELNADVNSYLDNSSESSEPVVKNVMSGKKTATFQWAKDTFFNKKFDPKKPEDRTLYRIDDDNVQDVQKIENEIKKDFNKIKDIKNIDKKSIKEKLFLVDGKVSIKKIFFDCVALGATLFIAFMLYSLVCITFAPRVDYKDLYSYVDQSSIIYDDQGKHIDSIYFDQNRKILSYKEMPEDLINSFVALEDKTFWKHHGFNWVRMVGAVVSSVTGGGQISGTSTITQQLARNVYLADIKSVRSIRRKILEMYYASRIEANMSKEQIVEAYLNTIYLGYGCYGVDAASKAYFSKDVKDLTLLECAALAALPQAPDSYALVKYADNVNEGDTNIIVREPDTYIANDLAIDRRKLCLKFMKEQGYITKNEYSSNVDIPLIKFINPTIKQGNGDNSYFHEYLIDTIINDLMEKYKMEYEDAERMLYTQGLKVYSTLDSTAQKTVVKEFKDPANYPGISGLYNQDAEGNIVNEGIILLYNYENMFDEDGDFTLTEDEGSVNSDGSITIKHGGRLNIYTTTVAGETDYSLEFKQSYTLEDSHLFSIPGGYINVPANYKSLDENDNLIISADYFKDHPGEFKINGKTITITNKAYSLPQKTIQPQSAMVIVGVGTGEVKSMVGGRSTKGERLLNRALNPRQPGSSIKPLAVYGAALQKSYELSKQGKEWEYTDYHIDSQGTRGYGAYITTHSSVADERTHVNGEYWPYNSNNAFTGTNTFMTAIQQSINTCAFKLQMQVGAEYSAQMLDKFGLSTVITDTSQEVNDMNPAALALGGMSNGVMPLEMALAYSTFPAGGKVNTPICYTKIVDRNGEVILEGKSEQTDVLDPGVSWIMTEVLKSVVSKGIAYPAAVSAVPSGGKTGTTNDQYDIWFDGFTPTYAAALWIGTDNNIKMSTMSGPAAALWGKIMNQIPKACTGEYAAQPENVIEQYGYYYTKGTEKGLTSYKAAKKDKDKDNDNDDNENKNKKDERDSAYKAWLSERESHKHWVVDSAGHYETITTDEWEKEPVYDEEGNIVEEGVHKTKEVWVEEKGHYEYDKGWRDGDFK